MARRPKYELKYAPEVYEHMQFIQTKHHRLIAASIKQQLSHTPEVRTRNRKPLKEPAEFGATWELRFGPSNSFRVFYEVDRDEATVTILAIGIKEGNRLFIGGKEFEL
jgi:mRNA-degrading endonuclease RelE of RelBE toxin-antitoxin system